MLVAYKSQIAAALPRHVTPDRMARVALTAYRQTPELADCDPVTVFGCVIQASQLGLDLGGVLGQSYLVPFRNTKKQRMECQLIVGYKGYLVLARRSGEVSHFSAHVVHEKDVFSFEYGTEARLIHKPVLRDRGDPIACYAVLRLRDGSHDFEVWGWEKVLEWQNRYGRKGRNGEGYGPWYDHLPEMARKSLIRALAKRAPVSVEIQRAVSLDDAHEAGLPQLDTAELVGIGIGASDQLAARVEFAAERQAVESESAAAPAEQAEKPAKSKPAGKIPSRVDEARALMQQLNILDADGADFIMKHAGEEKLEDCDPEKLAAVLAALQKEVSDRAAGGDTDPFRE